MVHHATAGAPVDDREGAAPAVATGSADLGGDPPCWADLVDDQRRWTVVHLDDVTAGKDESDGAVWSLPHDGDLDANLVRLGPGSSIGDHVNDEVDVLMVVRRGSGSVIVDGDGVVLEAGTVLLVPHGDRRAITAGDDGLEFLSIHRRRGPFGIGRAGSR